jgi:hypothetical protein
VQQRLIIEWRGSVINQTAERVLRGALSVLNPPCLIDGLLDWIDELGATILPAQDEERACRLAPVEVRLD